MIYLESMTKHVSKFLVAVLLVLAALVLLLVSPLYGAATAQSFWEKTVPETQAQIELSYAPLVKDVSHLPWSTCTPRRQCNDGPRSRK